MGENDDIAGGRNGVKLIFAKLPKRKSAAAKTNKR